jgi:hypothetical protein
MKTSFLALRRCLAPLSMIALGAPALAVTGPSSSQSPYLVPLSPAVSFTSVTTVGDPVPGAAGGTYRMVGIPDGMGAFDNSDGTFTVLMNHELGFGAGAVRAHGATGAFISKFIIKKSDLSVVSGADLIQQVASFNSTTGQFNAPAKGIEIGRLCSADLAAPGVYSKGALGTKERVFLSGEEVGAEGRLFAHLLDGTSYELPAHGKFSWENAVVSPFSSNKTIVVGLDDSGGGQVYVYVGQKTNTGNEVEKAGLNNGVLYGVKAADAQVETVEGISPRSFSLAPLGDVSRLNGVALEANSVAAGVTGFLRPEDGAWDPRKPNDFYFVTTASFDGPSRLWRLRFADVTRPEQGGKIEMILDGTEGQRMFDNMTITKDGVILLQEDPGGQTHLARIWRYDITSGRLSVLAQHDPARFLPGAPNFLTIDEESSGILPLENILGKGTFLLNIQAHYPLEGELVQGGQLLVMRQAAVSLEVKPSVSQSTYDLNSSEPLVYTTRVKNSGSGSLVRATVTQTFPSNFVVESVTDINGGPVAGRPNGNVVKVSFGTLAPDDERVIIIKVRPSETGRFKVSAVATATGDRNRRETRKASVGVTVQVPQSLPGSARSKASAAAPSNKGS